MFIRLLGAVGAGPDEARVGEAPGQVAAGVLAQLALASGRLVTAEVLAGAVWEDPPDSARNAIQVAVSKLRKAYGPELIESSRAGYRLRSGVVRVDWDEAARHVADARAALDAGRAREAVTAAETARALFGGQPLAGWVSTTADATRQRARELQALAAVLQARALVQCDRADSAVDVLRQQTASDPLDEPAHVALMEALAAAGRPGEALSVYDELRRRLADELGVDPSPAARELFARLLDGTAVPVAPAPAAPARRPAAVRLPATAGVLVGRDDEVGTVAGLIWSGHRLVTLVGPGGIGKTRLAVAVAQHVARVRERPAVFVDLSGAAGSGDVARAVATALDAEGGDVGAALRGSAMVVVLDNAEHVLDDVVDAVTDLLPVEGVDVLVTSRSPLKLREERVVALDVLGVDGVDAPGVRLLADRAGLSPDQVAAQREDLVALARAADGVPLVLELLASAMRWYTPAVLLKQVDTLLLELTDDARDRPRRHLSVTAATEWSVRQASPEARAALGALTVARGSFSRAAAEEIIAAAVAAVPAVAPGAVLAELVDLSLV